MVFTFAELIGYFGGALGIIVTIVMVASMKGKPIIKISLALLLLIVSFSSILGTLTYSGKIIDFPNLFRVDSPLHYLFPSVTLFYVYATFKPDFKFRKIYLLNLLPFLIHLIELMPFYLSSTASKSALYVSYMQKGSAAMPIHYILKAVLIFIYFLFQLRVFIKYIPDKSHRNAYKSSLLKWFFALFTGEAIFLFGIFLEILSGFTLFHDSYRFSMYMTAYLIYQISLSLLFIPRMLYGNMMEPESEGKKYSGSRLHDEEKSIILYDLELYMNKREKPYLNPRISLEEVSRKLNVPSGKLSQVVNEMTGKNFNQYINDFRIVESKTLLVSNNFNKLTIEAIAHNSGFNSKSQFYESFKKHTGMTPKEFVQIHGKTG